MYGQHSDIDFQMIAVSVSLAAVHGEAHFVTARPERVWTFIRQLPARMRRSYNESAFGLITDFRR